MSSTEVSISSTFSQPSSSASTAAAQSSASPATPSSGGFYRNLFYILIGLLCAFGFVSFLSLMRARRRRAAILQEAERLGVLVPGAPGYIPLRDRINMKWHRRDGRDSPDWWEVEGKRTPTSDSTTDNIVAFRTTEADFHPLALIPPIEPPDMEPLPVSSLPYFPNNLAYRPDRLLPPLSRFKGSDPTTLDALDGEHVEVLTIIQMPTEPWPEGKAVDEGEEVTKEWGGVMIGISRFEVGPRSG